MDTIRTEDVLKKQRYDVIGIKNIIKSGDYTYIQEGQNRKTIVRNKNGQLEGLFLDNVDLINPDVRNVVDDYVKDYSFVIVCPFLYHIWEFCKN